LNTHEETLAIGVKGQGPDIFINKVQVTQAPGSNFFLLFELASIS